MRSEINLLPQKRKGFLTQEKLLLITKGTAVASIILVVSISLVFFLLSRDPTALQLKSQESRLLAQLTILQGKTAKYLIIVDRLGKIHTIQKKADHLDTALAALTAQIPSGVQITTLTLDTGSLSLAISSSDLTLIGRTIDNYSALLQQKKLLKTLTIQGLVSDEKSGKYILTLTATLL